MRKWTGTLLAGVLALGAAGVQAQAPTPQEYKLGPDSLATEGVPKGKVEGPFLFRSKVFDGTVRKYWIYVPKQYKPETPANVLVLQDGQRALNPNGVIRANNVLDNLIQRGEIPVTIGIFITPGNRSETYPENLGFSNPDNRSVEYDSMGDAYARFIVDEMLPEVGKRYNLTQDPARRAIGGWSSGAIAAFTVAWERPEAFGNVISAIGSFTNLRGGHVYPELVRNTTMKPLRIFIQDGIHDNRSPQRLDRDWYLKNVEMVQALEARGYDLKYTFGEGNHSDNHGGAILPDILRWIFRETPVHPASR